MTAVLIGFLAGFLSGQFGVGGGLLTTPSIRVILGYPAFIAVGTPLVANIPTALAGAYTYARSNLVDRPVTVMLAISGVPGAVLGSYLSQFVSGHLILALTAGVILILGVRFPFQKNGTRNTRDLNGAVLFICGLAIGVASGFLGLGGGFLLIPFLTIVLGRDIKTSFGTSLAVIGAITIPGAFIHYLLGHVDIPLALGLIAGVIPGAVIGAKLAIRLPDRYLRLGFSTFLIIIAIYMGYQELRQLVT